MPHFYLKRQIMAHYQLMCQCPHGLMPHFYPHLLGKSCLLRISVNALTGLCLISTIHIWVIVDLFTFRVNALTGLCLISTVPLQKPRFYAVSRACFCRYLSEYSDSNCFSCMLTIWTYLTRYTYL